MNCCIDSENQKPGIDDVEMKTAELTFVEAASDNSNCSDGMDDAAVDSKPKILTPFVPVTSDRMSLQPLESG